MIHRESPLVRTALRHIALLALTAALAHFAIAQTAAAPAAAHAGPVPPFNGIAHIAIRVKDIAASVAFYNKLGFQQAFAISSGNVTTQSFIKLNDRQFIEIYPATGPETGIGFMHLCFEGADLNAVHDYYVAEGLAPSPVRTAGAGNLLFTLKGLQQLSVPQNIEYTQYVPGSLHSKDFGQHLGPDRVGDKMTVVALAMQDPAAAGAFYVGKLGFTPAPGSADRFNLPGASGEQVEIVSAAELGDRSSIILTTPNLDKAAAQLTRQDVAFKRASSAVTGGKGQGTRNIEMIAVTDPDGNIIRIEQQP
jgi:catechol 2,3-dioxygenase-like lactoylglutathione lyase family enzyme